MSYDIERAGWVWIDVRDPDKLDRSKEYRIEVGREYWTLRYRGLNEWFCSRRLGDAELEANSLIEAGCHVYVKREPERWTGIGHVSYQGGRLTISELDGIPQEALQRGYVVVTLVEAPEISEQERQDKDSDLVMSW